MAGIPVLACNVGGVAEAVPGSGDNGACAGRGRRKRGREELRRLLIQRSGLPLGAMPRDASGPSASTHTATTPRWPAACAMTSADLPMDLSPDTLDYLHGRRFSNGRAFDLGNRGPALRRGDRLAQLVAGMRVSH